MGTEFHPPDADKHAAVQTAVDVVESLVDVHGLDDVVAILGIVCHEKCIHVGANWQDKLLAGKWMAAARYLDRVSRAAAIKMVSP